MHILSTWLRRMTAVGLMMLGLVALAPASQAQTPDGVTPAVEPVCDELAGALYGLCVAYCEAMDCHLHADDTACQRVLANYMKHSDEKMPPCVGEEGGEDCDGEDCDGEDCDGEDCGGDEGGGPSEPPPA